jgi:hypothetical protein
MEDPQMLIYLSRDRRKLALYAYQDSEFWIVLEQTLELFHIFLLQMEGIALFQLDT